MMQEILKGVLETIAYKPVPPGLKVAFEEHSVRAYTLGLTEHLAKAGISVDLFTVRWDIKTVSVRKRYIPLPFASLKTSIRRYIRDLCFLSLLSLGNYDVLHVNDAATSWFIVVRAYEKGTPIVFTVHYVPQPEPIPTGLKNSMALLYEFEKYAIPFVAERAEAVIVPSEYARSTLVSTLGVKANVIYHGVDIERFRPMKPDENIRRRFKGKKIILWVSRFGFHAYKDPFTFIRAMPLVAQELQNVAFVMIGKGPLLPYALREAREVKKQGVDISIIRFVDDIVAWYNSADLFVLTSFNDTFGFVAAEAMACGRPVIVSDSGAPVEVVGNAGLVFKYGNPEDLANKILKVLTDEDLAYRLAIKGRERILKMFRWDIAAKKYAKLYKKLGG